MSCPGAAGISANKRAMLVLPVPQAPETITILAFMLTSAKQPGIFPALCLCLEQNPKGIRPAVTGNRTAGPGHIDMFKMHCFLDRFLDQLYICFIYPGMSDEYFICINLLISRKLVFCVAYQHLIQVSPVLFAHSHSPRTVIHLNTRL